MNAKEARMIAEQKKFEYDLKVKEVAREREMLIESQRRTLVDDAEKEIFELIKYTVNTGQTSISMHTFKHPLAGEIYLEPHCTQLMDRFEANGYAICVVMRNMTSSPHFKIKWDGTSFPSRMEYEQSHFWKSYFGK